MFSNISTLYAWRYITNASSLVTIINNFVLKKIACIYIVKNPMKWCTKVVFGKTLTQNCCKKWKRVLSIIIASWNMYLFFKCCWWDTLLTNTFQERESLLRVSKINIRSTWWLLGLLQKKGIILPLIVCHIIRFSESVNQSCIPNWIRNLGFGGEC